jgi:hypothetical protein
VVGDSSDLLAEATDLTQVGQVGQHGWRCRPVEALGELGCSAVEPVSAATVQDQLRSVRGQTVGEGSAESVGRAGDQDGPGVAHGVVRGLLRWVGTSVPVSVRISSLSRASSNGSRVASIRYQMTPKTMSSTVDGLG